MMKKTAVLYICHIIDDETRFRYAEMKRGAAALGYDIFWAIDATSVKFNAEIPQDINFYTFSIGEFKIRLPYCVFTRHGDQNFNATPSAAHLFHEDHPEYDFMWNIEYDMCYLGDWETFFKKYDADDSEFITTNMRLNDFRWMWFRKEYFSQEIEDALAKDGVQRWASFNPCTRTSGRLMDGIKEFLKKYNDGSCFFEWSWITAAKFYGYSVVEMVKASPRWGCTRLHQDFNGWTPNALHHRVKGYVNWKSILAKYKINS